MQLLQASGDPLELAAEAGLPRVVGAVGEPDRDGGRSQRDAQLDDGLVVLDGELPHARIRVAHRPELVGDLAIAGGGGIVLEGVRVHRVEAQAQLGGVLRECGGVGRIVPGDVQAHAAVGARECVEGRDVVDLLLGGSRLARRWESCRSGCRPRRAPRRARRPGTGRSRRRAPSTRSPNARRAPRRTRGRADGRHGWAPRWLRCRAGSHASAWVGLRGIGLLEVWQDVRWSDGTAASMMIDSSSRRQPHPTEPPRKRGSMVRPRIA